MFQEDVEKEISDGGVGEAPARGSVGGVAERRRQSVRRRGQPAEQAFLCLPPCPTMIHAIAPNPITPLFTVERRKKP